MRDDSVIKFLVAMSASNLSSSDFRNVVSWIKNSEEENVSRLYSLVRNRVRHIEFELLDPVVSERLSPSISRSATADVVGLQRASGLSVKEAVYRLERELEKSGANMDASARFSTKEGFRSWVSRSIGAFGENRMLSAAIEAFGKRSGGESDWKLG